jgi:hypothetical protein
MLRPWREFRPPDLSLRDIMVPRPCRGPILCPSHHLSARNESDDVFHLLREQRYRWHNQWEKSVPVGDQIT